MARMKAASQTSNGSSSKSTKPSPVANITSKNYADVAKAFIGASGDEGFMIARVYTQQKSGYRMYATPHEWGAWRAYLLGLGLNRSVESMDARGYYMVPARWPNEFDADVSEQDCIDTGNQFAIHVKSKKDQAEVHVDRDRVLREMLARMAA